MGENGFQTNFKQYNGSERILSRPDSSLIESDFPSVEISKVAKRESWRKEVYRPPHYLHKWWGRRLGSVFRAILVASCIEEDESVMDYFYEPIRSPGITVYDPMMGSGITVGESLKLGADTIGRDINPIAVETVRSAVGKFDKVEVEYTFEQIQNDVANEIKSWYRGKTRDDELVDVLYYFWVKTIRCPDCEESVDLFKNRIFSKHAYPNKHPESQSICPHCEAVNEVHYQETSTECGDCSESYNPQNGPARRSRATCPVCECDFKIIEAVQQQNRPPDHRMYAKMVLTNTGEKEYHRITDYDRELYQEASERLAEVDVPVPDLEIRPGYNTDQIRNYNYQNWQDLFNERQLLALGMLAERISKIEDEDLRSLFITFFSGVLEFNSMLCSFKGEGTGAVRHTFSHHILKPEKTPLEANPWGTRKSSGSFSTLFNRRVLNAIDYKLDPFELRLDEDGSSQKVRGINENLNREIAQSFSEFENKNVYLSTGDSSKTDIDDNSVDLVVTDPPFFDNVHYSQLADYFYAWQREISETQNGDTTRSDSEIQQTDAKDFAANLGSVFAECNRVMKDDGLLIFTYHHSRSEGWQAILSALRDAGYSIEAAHPVKSEMSVGVPKSQSENPINIDVIFVCKGLENLTTEVPDGILEDAVSQAEDMAEEFENADIEVSQNDLQTMAMADTLIHLSSVAEIETTINYLNEVRSEIQSRTNEIISSD